MNLLDFVQLGVPGIAVVGVVIIARALITLLGNHLMSLEKEISRLASAIDRLSGKLGND